MSDVIKEKLLYGGITEVMSPKKKVHKKTPRIRAVMTDGKKRKNMQIDMVLLNTILMPMHSSMILILMPHTKL
jgi:hypothetical protein